MPGMSPSKRKGKQDAAVELNITSLMDAFTIVLIFLIKQYGSNVIDVAEGYKPPTAETRLAVDRVLALQVKQVGNNVIRYRIGSHPQKSERKDPRVGYAQLRRDLTDEKVLVDAALSDENLKGAVNIVGDASIEFSTVMDIMQSAAGAGFFKLKLVAQP